jgi:Ner family transcriptional regulator
MFNHMMKIDNETKQLLKNPKKRHAWVIYQVTLQGRSLAQIADNAGVSRQCLYQVFRRTYPRMEKVVAEALGMAPADLWPERYDADGLPLYRMGRPVGGGKKSIDKDTRKRASRNVHNKPACRQDDAA